MPDIRVNLVPKAIARKARARRQRGIVAAGGVVVLALLGAGVVLQDQRVAAANEELEIERAELSQLQAEQRSLDEFATLEAQREELTATIATILGGQATVSGVLQDVAAVMPPDSALLDLAVNLDEVPEGSTFGSVSATAQSLRGHAPGVERVLISFEKVNAFHGLYLGSSSDPGEGVADFDFEFLLGPEVLSGRYVDGLPEVLR